MMQFKPKKIQSQLFWIINLSLKAGKGIRCSPFVLNTLNIISFYLSIVLKQMPYTITHQMDS